MNFFGPHTPNALIISLSSSAIKRKRQLEFIPEFTLFLLRVGADTKNRIIFCDESPVIVTQVAGFRSAGWRVGCGIEKHYEFFAFVIFELVEFSVLVETGEIWGWIARLNVCHLFCISMFVIQSSLFKVRYSLFKFKQVER